MKTFQIVCFLFALVFAAGQNVESQGNVRRSLKGEFLLVVPLSWCGHGTQPGVGRNTLALQLIGIAQFQFHIDNTDKIASGIASTDRIVSRIASAE